MKALALTLALLAAPSRAFEIPGYELIYSYPVETALEEADLRRAQDAWPAMFDAAKKSIDLEQFYIAPLAGEPLQASLDALKRAGERGVKIRFLLEKKFEKNSADGVAILKTIKGLETRYIDWSKLGGKGIVHAKFFIVDGKEAFVGSQNFDWRSLKHIHELGLRVTEPAAVERVGAVFAQDWHAAGLLEKGEGVPALQPQRPEANLTAKAVLVASPWLYNPPGVGDSETALVRLIGEARTEVAVQLLDYKPVAFGKPARFYPPIDNALRDAALRGVKVKLLVSHWNTDADAVVHLKSLAQLPGVEVKIVTIPQAKQGFIPFARVIHSKYMVVDGGALWLGTSNWAGGYLDESRNLEFVLRSPEMAARARKIHERLWTGPYAAPLDLRKTYPQPKRG